jgi:hypothetical protein
MPLLVRAWDMSIELVSTALRAPPPADCWPYRPSGQCRLAGVCAPTIGGGSQGVMTAAGGGRANPPMWLAAGAWAGPLTLSADLADLSVSRPPAQWTGLGYRQLRQSWIFHQFWPGGGPDVGVAGLGPVRAGPLGASIPVTGNLCTRCGAFIPAALDAGLLRDMQKPPRTPGSAGDPAAGVGRPGNLVRAEAVGQGRRRQPAAGGLRLLITHHNRGIAAGLGLFRVGPGLRLACAGAVSPGQGSTPGRRVPYHR